MKFWKFIIGVSILVSCQEASPTEEPSITVDEFDSLLAAKWEADEYGMKTYYWVDLIAGEQRDQTPSEVDSIQKGHMAHINHLADRGYLVLAGPFLDSNAIRGIFILNAANRAVADSLVAQDPAVQSGRLIMQIRPWYGSAAVMGINEAHNKVAKIKI